MKQRFFALKRFGAKDSDFYYSSISSHCYYCCYCFCIVIIILRSS